MKKRRDFRAIDHQSPENWMDINELPSYETVMPQREITDWLENWRRSQLLSLGCQGVFVLLGGVLLLALTWGVIYMVSLFSAGHWIGISHWMHWALGLIAIPILFLGEARTSREYLGKYSMTPGPASDKVVVFEFGGRFISNANPLAPGSMHAVIKMITDCILVGPRVFKAGMRTLRKANRIRQLDVIECGGVLATLATAGGRISFHEVVNRTPGCNPVTAFPQLREIEGVLFLESDPPGLSLTTELREKLTSLIKTMK